VSDLPRKPAGPTGLPDPWRVLRSHTAARIGLGRAGSSVPTRPLLEFQLAHARARDAVHRELDAGTLASRLRAGGREVLLLHSAATDRAAFIGRPDLGRILDEASKCALEARPAPDTPFDVAFVIADGLSALAVETHAEPFLATVLPALDAADWRVAPLAIVRQGRVAVADEVAVLLQARLSVILIGERPGLSAADSLGLYLTWDPLPGRSNAERNCISNIRPPDGLSYALAAHKLMHLMTEARRRKLSGVDLKEDAPALPTRGGVGALD
jgi:ethanolamine ammonia-lyase small subunit